MFGFLWSARLVLCLPSLSCVRVGGMGSLKAVFEETMGAAIPDKRKYIVLDMTMDNGSADVIIPQVQFYFA
jgi:hypothetical protein